MHQTSEGLSVIVPCYNEAQGIQPVLARLHAVLAGASGSQLPAWEIIVVDDGSTDGAAERVDPALCRLIRHAENRGYGAALKTGAAAARHDLLAIIDADGTYPCEQLVALVEGLGDAEMIVASRTGARVAIPVLRRPAKWILGRLANYLTGRRIPDLNSGLRVIRRPLWDRYARFFPNGFSLTTTITLAALCNGHEVRYLPIDYHARVGTSKIRPIHDTIEFTKLILRTVIYFDPLKVFVPLSLGLFALSLVVGVGTLVLSHGFGIGQFMDVTTVLLFIASVQTLAIGMLADLITKRIS